MHPKLVSLLGVVFLIATAWLLSVNRRRFPWRTVLTGLALQFGFALLILRTEAGRGVFQKAQGAFDRLLDCAREGAEFVFGPLAKGPLLAEKLGPGNAYIFVVMVSATIILISALSSFLYHYGILQRVVRALAWVMQRLMGTSGSESLAAAANIFMGQTEAPLVIKPYLRRMTRSEHCRHRVGRLHQLRHRRGLADLGECDGGPNGPRLLQALLPGNGTIKVRTISCRHLRPIIIAIIGCRGAQSPSAQRRS